MPATAGCLIRKRPQPELLLADLPEPRQPPRLDDQEEDDEAAEDHGLQVAHGVDGDLEAEHARRVVEEDRQQHDEAGAEERAQYAAQPADDNHEEDLERAV